MCFVSPTQLYILYEDGRVTKYSSTGGFSDTEFVPGGVSHIIPGFESGQVFCAGRDGKIYLTDINGKTLPVADIGESVSALAFDAGARLYAAGVDSGTIYSIVDSIPEKITSPVDAAVSSLIVLDGGIIWAATGQGLYRWKDSGWSRYSTSDGLVSNRVNDLVFDGNSSLLLATSKGVQTLNVSNPDVSNSKLFFPGSSYAYALKPIGKDGVFYFGGNGVLSVVTPETSAAVVPFSFPDDSQKPEGARPKFFIWAILGLICFAVAGFFPGKYFSNRKSKETLDIPSVTTDIAGSKGNPEYHSEVALDQPVDISLSTVPAPSHEDVFKAIEHLSADTLVPDFSLKVWRMIEESYQDHKFTVESIASRLMFSRVHLNRRLKQEIGVSPSALLKARRMSAARSLMLKGGIPLQKIAQMTGFSSAAFLSTSFKEYYGQSPSELIKSSQ